MTAAAPSVLDMLTAWRPQVGTTVVLGAAAVLYAVGWRRLADARRAGADGLPAGARVPSAWPLWRVGAFLAGLGALAVGLESGVDRYASALLSVHMLQHGLLTMVAPPLLLAGAPVALLVRASPPRARRAFGAVLRTRVLRAVSHPALGWSLLALAMLALHATPLFDAAVGSPWLHAAEHGLYVAAGLLFWLPLVPGNPVPQRLGWLGRTLYLMLAMPPMAALGVWLAAGDAVRYPAYLEPARALGISALDDQQAAGIIMTMGSTLVMATAVVILVLEALGREERLEVAREAYARGPEYTGTPTFARAPDNAGTAAYARAPDPLLPGGRP